MNGRLGFASPTCAPLFSAGILSGVIAGTLLSAVVFLFQSRGTPLETAAAAERVCGHYLYRSEQDACIKEWLAARRATTVARR